VTCSKKAVGLQEFPVALPGLEKEPNMTRFEIRRSFLLAGAAFLTSGAFMTSGVSAQIRPAETDQQSPEERSGAGGNHEDGGHEDGGHEDGDHEDGDHEDGGQGSRGNGPRYYGGRNFQGSGGNRGHTLEERILKVPLPD